MIKWLHLNTGWKLFIWMFATDNDVFSLCDCRWSTLTTACTVLCITQHFSNLLGDTSWVCVNNYLICMKWKCSKNTGGQLHSGTNFMSSPHIWSIKTCQIVGSGLLLTPWVNWACLCLQATGAFTGNQWSCVCLRAEPTVYSITWRPCLGLQSHKTPQSSAMTRYRCTETQTVWEFHLSLSALMGFPSWAVPASHMVCGMTM